MGALNNVWVSADEAFHSTGAKAHGIADRNAGGFPSISFSECLNFPKVLAFAPDGVLWFVELKAGRLEMVVTEAEKGLLSFPDGGPGVPPFNDSAHILF
jgi:hypothetical protein